MIVLGGLRFPWVLGFCVLLSQPVLAQSDAMDWLQRASQAARKLNYVGTFIYQSGGAAETSRITHLVDSAGEGERLEVLDGSPREVVRINDEVKCYLPENQTVIVERRSTQRPFPSLLPVNFGGSIGQNYVIRMGGVSRVAGLDTQNIHLEPRDELRFGHEWWVDKRSGLLVKATLLGKQGESLESFVFTELNIGGQIDREAIKPRASIGSPNWKVRQPRDVSGPAEGDIWVFRNALPGFRKISDLKRQVHGDSPAGMHWVFSDGLAAISVFIHRVDVNRENLEIGMFSMGAVNIYKRISDGHLIVVMGDVPHLALRRLSDGIGMRRP